MTSVQQKKGGRYTKSNQNKDMNGIKNSTSLCQKLLQSTASPRCISYAKIIFNDDPNFENNDKN